MGNTTQKLVARYGYPDNTNPEFTKHLVLWILPTDITRALPAMPQRIYCNRDLVRPLRAALRAVIKAFYAGELEKLDSIRTYDGCFNIRFIYGTKKLSTHSWAIAIDLNAFRNGLGKKPTFSEKFARIWEAHGFIWGGRWKRPDGMHFELDLDKEHIWSKL